MSIYQRNLQIKKSWLALDDLIDKYVQYLCQRKCNVPYVQDGVQKVLSPCLEYERNDQLQFDEFSISF